MQAKEYHCPFSFILYGLKQMRPKQTHFIPNECKTSKERSRQIQMSQFLWAGSLRQATKTEALPTMWLTIDKTFATTERGRIFLGPERI